METRVSLLQRVSAGSEDAWAELAELYQPLVAGWLRRYNLAEDDAEDLSQEVMSVLIREVRNFDHNGRIGAFRSWLKQVTANRATEFLRRTQRRPVSMGGSSFQHMLGELQDPDSEISRLFDREHDMHVLANLLLRVASECKAATMDIFRLHVLIGRDANDIARETGVTPHAVYMAKSRILRRPRQLAPGLLEESE